jgi:hypothetical protein
MVKVIAGVIAGIVAAFATVWGTDMVGHAIHPVPADLNVRDYEAVGAFIRTMPPLALAIVALAWFLGALVGGFVAGKITDRRWAVWLVAGLVAAAGVANVLMIPHPVLLQIAAVAAPLLGGFVASRILGRRRAGEGGV